MFNKKHKIVRSLPKFLIWAKLKVDIDSVQLNYGTIVLRSKRKSYVDATTVI